MPSKETLIANDDALHTMFKADTLEGPLSPEDQQAYQELIAEQRRGHVEAIHDESAEKTSRSVGNVALGSTNAPKGQRIAFPTEFVDPGYQQARQDTWRNGR